MPLDDAMDHGQSEAGTTLSFGGEEWFQTALLYALTHAYAGIAHPEHRPALFNCGFQGDGTSLRHGIDSIEEEIGENFTQSRFFARDHWGRSKCGRDAN